jgi:hypothetical protein
MRSEEGGKDLEGKLCMPSPAWTRRISVMHAQRSLSASRVSVKSRSKTLIASSLPARPQSRRSSTGWRRPRQGWSRRDVALRFSNSRRWSSGRQQGRLLPLPLTAAGAVACGSLNDLGCRVPVRDEPPRAWVSSTTPCAHCVQQRSTGRVFGKVQGAQISEVEHSPIGCSS